MGAICVKNQARTASQRSIGSSALRPHTHMNTIQTKMEKSEYQRLQIIKQNLTSSTGNSPTKSPTSQNQLRQIGDFKFIRHLGDGSYGQVLMVKDLKSSQHYAMKIIRKQLIIEREEILNALSQRYILAAMDHPFVVKLHYAFQTKNKIFLIVDLMSGGELFYLLRRNKFFPQQTARFYAAQILLALEYLHSKKIIYRDLKPQNILLDKDGHIKLTDFGLSKVMLKKNQVATSVCGTPQYIAPEVLKGKGYTVAADWFSFGSLLYDMLTGKPPFYSKDKEEMMSKIQTKQIPFPQFLSPAAKSLLKSLFEKKESNRLGFKFDADEIKKHQFFRQINFDDIYNKRIKAPFSFQQNINSEGFAIKFDEFQVEQSYQKQLIEKSKGVNFQGFTYQVKAAKYPESKASNQFSLGPQKVEKFENQNEGNDVDMEMQINDAQKQQSNKAKNTQQQTNKNVDANHKQNEQIRESKINNSSQKSTKRSTFSMSIHEMEKKNNASNNTPQKIINEFKVNSQLQPIKQFDKHSLNINETLNHDNFQSPKLQPSLNPILHETPKKRQLSFANIDQFQAVKQPQMQELKL